MSKSVKILKYENQSDQQMKKINQTNKSFV